LVLGFFLLGEEAGDSGSAAGYGWLLFSSVSVLMQPQVQLVGVKELTRGNLYDIKTRKAKGRGRR